MIKKLEVVLDTDSPLDNQRLLEEIAVKLESLGLKVILAELENTEDAIQEGTEGLGTKAE